MLKPLFLKVFHQGRLLKIQPFTEEQISVGGGEGLSLVLKGLAPWHILIEKKGDSYIIFDLGSEIGTVLNGQRVTGECELSSGSLIVLGEYQIQFFIGPPPPRQSRPAPLAGAAPSPPVEGHFSGTPAQKAAAVAPPQPAGPGTVPHSPAPPVQKPVAVSSRPAGLSFPERPSAPGSDPHYAERPPQGPEGLKPVQKPAPPHSIPGPAPHSSNESFQKPEIPPSSPGAVSPLPRGPFQKTAVSPSRETSVRPAEGLFQKPPAPPSHSSNSPLATGAPIQNQERPSVPSAPQRVPPSPTGAPSSESPAPPPLKRAVGYSVPFPAPPPAPPSPETVPSPPESARAFHQETQPLEQAPSPPVPPPPSEKKERKLFSFRKKTSAPLAEPDPGRMEEGLRAESSRGHTQPDPGLPEAGPPSATPPSGLERPFVSGAGGSDFSPSSAVGAFQKPDKKGFWKTFAPAEKIKSLDEYLTPSIGNFIEVIVAWKERIISSHHFSKGPVYMGASRGCEVPVTNLLGVGKYKLLDIQGTAQVFFQGVTGALIQGKEKSTRTSHPITGNQSVVLKPYEMIRMDFQNALKVYVRIKSKPASALAGRVFHFNLAELSVLFFSFLLTGLLVFYSGFYAPLFLLEDEKFVEENIQKAVVKFVKPPRVPPVQDYQLKKKTQKAKVKGTLKKKKAIPRKKTKRASIPSKKAKPKKTKLKKWGLKALGRKKGKTAASTRGKKKSKIAAGSIRPGGSLKTGKAGATAKTVAPDPTKMGLLGVFGKGGRLKNLDQGATGSAEGGLVGLAEGATGFAGTRESYGGEGVGTRTKEMVSGGKGSALVGISGIKVKGRGGSFKGAGAGGLGTRGRMSIDIGADDIDVEGTIDRDAILRVIFKNHRRFDHCYQAGLQGDGSLQGNLKMQWQILSNGRVRGARALRDGVGSRSLANCVANVLTGLRFPIPPSGQIPRISFKFVFSK